MHIEVWQGKSGWYWHFRSKGNITADSEAFPSKGNAIRAAKAVVRGVIKRLHNANFKPDPPRFESSGDAQVIIKWY